MIALRESRLCTQEEFSTEWYRRWCARMAEPPILRRKQWEFCAIAEALDQRGVLQAGSRGLGFGVGQEPLPALFASFGCHILATDVERGRAEAAGWAQTGQHADSLAVLNTRGLCSEAEFHRLVSFQTLDMNAIPSDLVDFDFVWSACSFEHLGSLENGLRFCLRAMDCLRPGGVAVHTTEYNLSSNTETLESEHLVLYRHSDINGLAHQLREAGHSLSLDFSAGKGPADRYVDVPPYTALPHLKLQLGRYDSTSLVLVIEKGSSARPHSSAPMGSEHPQRSDSPDPARATKAEIAATGEDTERVETIESVYQRVLGRPVDTMARSG